MNIDDIQLHNPGATITVKSAIKWIEDKQVMNSKKLKTNSNFNIEEELGKTVHDAVIADKTGSISMWEDLVDIEEDQ